MNATVPDPAAASAARTRGAAAVTDAEDAHPAAQESARPGTARQFSSSPEHSTGRS